MIKYALYDYIPKSLLNFATFEQQDICKKILDFKEGRIYAAAWAAKTIAHVLSLINLNDVTIVFIPASCEHSYIRRWKRFSNILCSLSGAVNGLEHIRVIGKREKFHKQRNNNNILKNVLLDEVFFEKRKVVIIDDIFTTGATSDKFIKMLENAGADVKLAVFLGKTKQFTKLNTVIY